MRLQKNKGLLLSIHFFSMLLVAFTLWQWGSALSIAVKAHLAQWLIKSSWAKSLETHQIVKPWPWADTWPVAKIIFPSGEAYFVLKGSTGNSLAFGPGHVSSTALPGEDGASVIAGHRDTHFALLENLRSGQKIKVQNKAGEWFTFEINKQWIANSNLESLYVNNQQSSLLLITCYPFNALMPGGDQRFLVSASLSQYSNQ
jgi:sortase A